MLALALLALAPAPQACDFDFTYKFTAHGVLQGVAAPLAAPLTGAANGDPVTLGLELDFSDFLCVTPAGLDGVFSYVECASLTVGALTGGQDPMSDACVWGEEFLFIPSTSTVGVDVDIPLEGGHLALRMRLDDPNLSVGIGFFDGSALASYPIDVGAVADPGFSAAMDLIDATGAVVGVIDLSLLEMEPPTVFPGVGIGSVYCNSTPNSTGLPAGLFAFGSRVVADNDVTLAVSDLPQQSFGFFICSQDQGFFANPGGSAGNLCLGGNIGRFVGPGQILFSGASSSLSFDVDLTSIPQPTAILPAQIGDIWNFQYWFRDTRGIAPTSNFSAAVAIDFI